MGAPQGKTENGEGLSALRSDKSVARLEQISSLRARGVGENIDLPQLVVCGDQSAGKSSVLEGISGIPFPRDEGVCTKFATEVILEHSDTSSSVSATIIPHASRTDVTRTKLQAFHRSINDFSELPDVIASAGALMGLRGYGANKDGPSFVEDVLRVKVTGQTGLHLSIVDLPGLISVASEVQTEEDVITVHRMVNSYVEKPRTIILAVVQASNDIANQSIIKKSKEYDKNGQRTVGIITKPDLINVRAEVRIAALAKNQDTTKLKLGFFLLKNPTPVELGDGITLEQRAANESRFFQSSPWKEQKLDPSRIGIHKLREYLQKLLDQHIERELPKVREEIRSLMKSTEQELATLPNERPTVGHLRMFLSSLAMQFHSLASAAVNGDYDTANSTFFAVSGNKPGPTRLRALVHEGNGRFKDCMLEYGRMLKTGDKSTARAKQRDKATRDSALEIDSSTLQISFSASDAAQRYVTDSELRAWIKETYTKTRGRELPGNYSHVLLTELFHYQSQKWESIAGMHLDSVHDTIVHFVSTALIYLNIEDYVLDSLKEGIWNQLEQCKADAKQELGRLCKDEKHQPMTYNHYYTDNVQKSRLDALKRTIEHAVAKAGNTNGGFTNAFNAMNPETLIATLSRQVNVDMDETACTEALEGLNAYYKVACKTFIDNVCRQVIERHLLRNLPEIFSPQRIAGLDDEELQRIAGERVDIVEKRKQLTEQVSNLKAGLNDLRK
ncbi:hypothetical protein LTR37_017878 [Vermiconidia calcicola]|uniref:Uncharacterized protein n=1 Tax=Vermiconidia calcicola TaxID=1690605 RepID=A0ACC3MIU8_9PEZI|nr:hypothetical protein LTR37_017878 [Vermiconidia calcicola]